MPRCRVRMTPASAICRIVDGCLARRHAGHAMNTQTSHASRFSLLPARRFGALLLAVIAAVGARRLRPRRNRRRDSRRFRRSPPPRRSRATSPSGTNSPAGWSPCSRSPSARASRASISAGVVRGRQPRAAGTDCSSRSTTARSRRRSTACARSWRRRRWRATAPPPRRGAPTGCRARTRCRSKSASAAPAPRPKRRRTSTPWRPRCAPPSSTSSFTRVVSPIDGRVEPRPRHPRQSRLGRPGRSHAADHRRVGRSDLRLVRRRRADVPALRRPRAPAAPDGKGEPADRDGARRRDRRSRTKARCSSSTTSSIPRRGRSAAARSSATPIVA